MALAKPKEWTGTTSGGLVGQKPLLCHTCKERKHGLFTIDPYGNPQCADCAAARGRPIV